MNGVSPALIVCAQVKFSETFSQIKPKVKTITLPKINAGNEVLNF